ncbi:flagellin [Candidatus Bathyarchaeota archaeon]|nr:MAG: flagellin [Candidatus Bathyarchaeota archaeon]
MFDLDSKANLGAVGIGALIIFIAVVLVAGIAASIIIQTMNDLQNRAMSAGRETMRDISAGIEVRQVSGYVVNSKIDQLAIFISPIVASEDIDLSHTFISLSDTNKKVILSYDSNSFSSSANGGVFQALNSSNLTSSTYGIVVIRDLDGSCTSTSPVINENDIVVLIINTTKCFYGISPRTEVYGNIVPEYGVNGVISFVTPPTLIDKIVDLQP